MKILAVENNVLAQRVETTKSDFINTGSSDQHAPLYQITYIAEKQEYRPGDYVLLQPKTYPGIAVEGKVYTVLTTDDIIAKVDGVKAVNL